MVAPILRSGKKHQPFGKDIRGGDREFLTDAWSFLNDDQHVFFRFVRIFSFPYPDRMNVEISY